MKLEINHRPGSSSAKVALSAGEKVITEGGAMIAMSGHINVETTTHQKKGGLLKGLKRMISGESFFLNHFHSRSNDGEVWLATTLPGDMECLELDDLSVIVQSGSFVACEESIEMDMSWTGLKSLFANEGLFWIKCHGKGKLLVNSFGAIYPIQVDGEYIIDTGHIVAFDETLNYSLTKAGQSWVSSFLGGEGLVCKFSGQGTVWCQSHNAPSFGHALGSQLRQR